MPSLDERTRGLLHSDAVKDLPDALADPESPNVRLWFIRLAAVAAIGWALGHLVGGYSSASRRSSPASRTARRFLR